MAIPSVCPSVTRVDQSKKLEVRIMQFCRVNEMPITDYVLEYNNFSLGDEDL